MKPPYVKKTVSRDPDQFFSELVGRSVAAMPTGDGFVGKLDRIDLGDVDLSFIRTSGKVLFYTRVPAGRAMLMFSREHGRGTNANGYFLESDSILVAGPHQPFGLTISGPSDLAVVNLPLASRLIDDLPNEFSSQFASLCETSKAWQSADGLNSLADVMQQIRSNVANKDVTWTMNTLDAHKQSLITGVVQSLIDLDRQPQKLSASSGLYKTFIEALYFIEPLLPDVVTVRQICTGTGIRERALQLAFRKFVDMTPGQYVRSRRLVACRRALLKAYSDEATVSGIAAAHGFKYPSQFSAYYKGAYGESPSATLRRSPQKNLTKQRLRIIPLAGLTAMGAHQLTATVQ